MRKMKKHLTAKIIVNRMVAFFDVTSRYFVYKILLAAFAASYPA